ncbi:uncharacterized protein LOC130928345 [Corythoichthys intestinalis]|uniref:uncharacterized protein LOC130928345 n=1 Tax=Corythoichthys intestinalis TaxID=161448 RepID=UPI0025A612DB|nr:uncharacterized protein LOC130928345 [Corythoichthys intestinalis]
MAVLYPNSIHSFYFSCSIRTQPLTGQDIRFVLTSARKRTPFLVKNELNVQCFQRTPFSPATSSGSSREIPRRSRANPETTSPRREATQWHPNRIPEPPHLAPLDADAQRLDSQMTRLLTLSLRKSLQKKLISAACIRDLVLLVATHGEGRDVDRPINGELFGSAPSLPRRNNAESASLRPVFIHFKGLFSVYELIRKMTGTFIVNAVNFMHRQTCLRERNYFYMKTSLLRLLGIWHTPFYTAHLWTKYLAKSMQRLNVAYNDTLTLLVCVQRQ